MSQRCLRQKPRISYYELEELNLDEYVYCDKCADLVFEYCAIHGPLLVIPDDKVSAKPDVPSFVPRAALTVPNVFIHLAPSSIPGAGLGMFSTLTLPSGVRFGPYIGERTDGVDSYYCWQIYDSNRKPSYCIDAVNADKSNWMRYVNCARHWSEQNLVAFQYQGQLYYRSIKIIPRFTELLVFYGSEFANELDIDLGKYNSPKYARAYGTSCIKKCKLNDDTIQEQEIHSPVAVVKEFNNDTIYTNSTDDNEKSPKDAKQWKEKTLVLVGAVSTILTQDLNTEKHIKESGTKLDQENCPINNISIDFDGSKSDNNSQLNYMYHYCDLCSVKFIGKCDLEKHMRFHDQNRAHACEVCTYRFSSLRGLKSHRLSVHQIKNTNNNHVCEICDKVFEETNKLLRHLRTHTGEKPYPCDTCNMKFITSSALKRHERTHTGEKPYPCDMCNMKFKASSSLKAHIRTHTGEKLQKPHACDTCDMKFVTSSALKRHIRTHTGEKPYPCDTCYMKFKARSSLKAHMRTHTGEKLQKPHACDTCNMKFVTSSALKRHIRTHTGEKPYPCDTCYMKFKARSSLKAHMRTHTGEKLQKPHACDTCYMKFAASNTLKVHMRTHTGERPYSCDTCNMKFATSYSLKVHIRTHTGERPYSCDTCNMKFATSNSLKVHIRTHTGERPYSCDTCNMKFATSNSLKVHIRTHTGERPYSCDTCNMKFATSNSLKRHKRTHV